MFCPSKYIVDLTNIFTIWVVQSMDSALFKKVLVMYKLLAKQKLARRSTRSLLLPTVLFPTHCGYEE